MQVMHYHLQMMISMNFVLKIHFSPRLQKADSVDLYEHNLCIMHRINNAI